MENQSVFVKKKRTILIHKFILKIISPVNLFIIPGQHCTLILDNLTDISHTIHLNFQMLDFPGVEKSI